MAVSNYDGTSVRATLAGAAQRIAGEEKSWRGHGRNRSVQWADWELRDVVDFTRHSETLVDEYTQTEMQPYIPSGASSIIDTLVQTSLDISTVASKDGSRSSSFATCTTLDSDEARQAALSDLITHLEDTAALLREHLAPPDIEMSQEESHGQTFFLLKYQIVLVLFTQFISILLLTLFDHLMHKVNDTGYRVLTVSCGAILQILNLLLVAFATAVLSKQMLRSKVEGSLMAQTYLATVVTFAGLYFIIYRVQPDSWEFSSSDRIGENVAIVQFIKMLYLSVSAATLCGAANIQPNSWYVTLLLCFQSLVNFVYFSAILAQTIGNYHSYTVQVRRSSSLNPATRGGGR